MAERRRTRGEEGQAIAELVIVAPVLMLVIVLMIGIGRIDSAQGDVESRGACWRSRLRSSKPTRTTPRPRRPQR